MSNVVIITLIVCITLIIVTLIGSKNWREFK